MTHLLILFFATFSAAFMATVPPGLLNMNAAKASVQKGKRIGVVFSFGVSSMILLQALVSVYISKFLYNNPQVIDTLLKAALVVFGGFSLYFFFSAKREKPTKDRTEDFSKSNAYFKGMLLALLNFLNIPYYSSLNAMWNQAGWIKFQWQDTLTFVAAAACGTFSVLYLYVFYFNKLETKTNRFSKNSDYILSALMAVLLMITLIRIFYK